MTHEFLEAFVHQRMRERGIEWDALCMLSCWRDPASNNILVRLGSKDSQERVILQSYMTDAEMVVIVDGALGKLFPPLVTPKPRVRRKRLAGRRGPLSPRHWTGAA